MGTVLVEATVLASVPDIVAVDSEVVPVTGADAPTVTVVNGTAEDLWTPASVEEDGVVTITPCGDVQVLQLIVVLDVYSAADVRLSVGTDDTDVLLPAVEIDSESITALSVVPSVVVNENTIAWLSATYRCSDVLQLAVVPACISVVAVAVRHVPVTSGSGAGDCKCGEEREANEAAWV